MVKQQQKTTKLPTTMTPAQHIISRAADYKDLTPEEELCDEVYNDSESDADYYNDSCYGCDITNCGDRDCDCCHCNDNYCEPSGFYYPSDKDVRKYYTESAESQSQNKSGKDLLKDYIKRIGRLIQTY